MADLTLTPHSPLAGYTNRIGDITISEIADLDIVSLALSANAKASLNKVLEEKTGLSFPDAGTTQRDGDNIALLGLGADQCFMVTHAHHQDPVTAAAAITGATAYLTDQSDSWVVVSIEGASALLALERICPVDLSDAVFTENSVVRTSMEHLSVIVERPQPAQYRLYSPRSSAHSFLHALVVSAENVTQIK